MQDSFYEPDDEDGTGGATNDKSGATSANQNESAFSKLFRLVSKRKPAADSKLPNAALVPNENTQPNPAQATDLEASAKSSASQKDREATLTLPAAHYRDLLNADDPVAVESETFSGGNVRKNTITQYPIDNPKDADAEYPSNLFDDSSDIDHADSGKF